jgi:hypothetical protein
MEETLARLSNRCYRWGPAPEIVDDYLRLAHQLPVQSGMQKWIDDYVLQHAGRVLWDVEFLLSNFAIHNVINIGGAPFLFEYLMKKARPDLDIISIDLQQGRFPGADKALGIKTIELDVERENDPAGKLQGQFQCVVFCEIFEHLRINLSGTMSFVRSLIADGGFIYLTTPNGLGIGAICSHLMHGRTGPDPAAEWSKLEQLGHMGHVREYSYVEVHDVLDRAGFDIEWHCYRRGNRRSGSAASRIADWSARALTRLVPRLGNEIVAVARRKD